MFVQVYHTNHNTTDTAYSGPPSKGARKPTAPGFRVASTPHRKNRFTSCKKGPRRDSQPGRGGFYPVMCTPTGAPSRRVFSIHCGAVPCDGSAKHPATVPGRWWLVGVHSATAPRFPGTVKNTGTHLHVVVAPGFRCRAVSGSVLWQHSKQTGAVCCGGCCPAVVPGFRVFTACPAGGNATRCPRCPGGWLVVFHIHTTPGGVSRWVSTVPGSVLVPGLWVVLQAVSGFRFRCVAC